MVIYYQFVSVEFDVNHDPTKDIKAVDSQKIVLAADLAPIHHLYWKTPIPAKKIPPIPI